MQPRYQLPPVESISGIYAIGTIGVLLPGRGQVSNRQPSVLECVASSEVGYSVLPMRISNIVYVANRIGNKDSDRSDTDTPETGRGRSNRRVPDSRDGNHVGEGGVSLDDRLPNDHDNIDGFNYNTLN
jgi:hypothetical protein